MKLGPKGFLTTVPYLFNLASFYLILWTKKFIAVKEDFIVARGLILLYSLLREFWEAKILEGIGNTFSSFIKISDMTKQGQYTSYAHIYIYMNVSKHLSDSMCLIY